MAELDRWADELRAAGGVGTSQITRSDIIRDIVIKATKERREAAQKVKGKR